MFKYLKINKLTIKSCLIKSTNLKKITMIQNVEL